MERVTIERIKAMDIATRTMIDMPVWRVRLDKVQVGLIMERDPVAGRIAFNQANLTEEEKKLVCETVADNLGVDTASYTVAPIEVDESSQDETQDYGDF